MLQVCLKGTSVQVFCTGLRQSPEWCFNRGFFCQQLKSQFLQKEYAVLHLWKELTAGSSLFFCIPSAAVTEQLD